MIKIDTFDTMQIKKSFTTLKGQERVKQILKNAEIVFLTKGYSGFSMRGVAAQSNISLSTLQGEFKHEVRQFQKPYDNQQAEQISLMV